MKGKQEIRNSVKNEKKFIESYLNMEIIRRNCASFLYRKFYSIFCLFVLNKHESVKDQDVQQAYGQQKLLLLFLSWEFHWLRLFFGLMWCACWTFHKYPVWSVATFEVHEQPIENTTNDILFNWQCRRKLLFWFRVCPTESVESLENTWVVGNAMTYLPNHSFH